MKATCWAGKNRVAVEQVPDPQLLSPRDIIVRVTSTAICGSDLHLYAGLLPMERGDVLGHEFMGEVVEVGREITHLRVGDRVIVPATVACGRCHYCRRELYSLCDNSNPFGRIAEASYGYIPAGVLGHPKPMGGYAGGQAEYARVPFADVGPMQVPDGLADEQVLFLTDIFPTGYMAVENADIQPGDVVAVWGCGPVGQFAIKSAYLLGAERVIAIDRIPERLALAARYGGAETLDYSQVDVLDALREMTGGRGPDACIDAVGAEGHSHGVQYAYDRAKQAMMLEMDRPIALREAILACGKGGTVSVIGAYLGISDKLPFGAIVNKSLTVRSGLVHVQRYMKPLLARIQSGEIDPTGIITHVLPLEAAPQAYTIFQQKQDGCVKVVLKPH
jgi:threonine dehydrogenase-like Zn-dependent dehydrogenase